jgi:hypothetical protein
VQANGHVLDIEVRTYQKAKPQLLKDHTGEWVLIQKKRIVGCYPDREAAIDAGYALNGSDFFTRQIQEIEPVRHMITLSFDKACQ